MILTSTEGIRPMARKTTKIPKADPTGPKYPKIHVRLTGQNGNAHNLIAVCVKAARDSDVPRSEIDAFAAEAIRGDYAHVIATCSQWFSIR
jgi:hypothetical protein